MWLVEGGSILADQGLSDDRHRGWPGLVRQVSVGTEMRGPPVYGRCDLFPGMAHVSRENAFTRSRTREERDQTKGKCHCLAMRALVPMARSIGRSELPPIRPITFTAPVLTQPLPSFLTMPFTVPHANGKADANENGPGDAGCVIPARLMGGAPTQAPSASRLNGRCLDQPLDLSKNCSSSVEPFSAVVELSAPSMAVVTASK